MTTISAVFCDIFSAIEEAELLCTVVSDTCNDVLILPQGPVP